MQNTITNHEWNRDHPAAHLQRIGIVAAGILMLRLSFQFAVRAPLSQYPLDIAIMLLVGLFGLGLVALAAVQRSFPWWRWLIISVYVIDVLARTVLLVHTTDGQHYVISDEALTADFAAEILLHGENPYAWDMTGVFDLYRTTQKLAEPSPAGTLQQVFRYPPLAFLLVVPFKATGLPGSFSLLVLAHSLVLVLIFLASPRQYQPVILLPAAMLNFTDIAITGTTDAILSLFLLAMLLAWNRPWVRALLFGLAASVGQVAWLLGPFLLIRLAYEEKPAQRGQQIGQFLLGSGSIVLAINLPFMVWNSRAWWQGVFEPLTVSHLFREVSLSGLTRFGYVDLPPLYYWVVSVTVLIALLGWYARHYTALRHLLWLMPGTAMWFSYGTPLAYWGFGVLLLLTDLMLHATDIDDEPITGWSARATVRKVLPTVSATLLLGIVLLATGLIWQSVQPTPIQARVHFPIYTAWDRLANLSLSTRISVEVTNTGDEVITPRFSVQGSSDARLPWYINQGPQTLAPGETGQYDLSNFRADRTFLIQQGAQIVVTDAERPREVYAVASIPPDPSPQWPDAIANPSYIYWGAGVNTPVFWGLRTSPRKAASVSYTTHAERDALELSFNRRTDSARAELTNWTVFPPRFGIWLYLDSATEAALAAYGVEFVDSEKRRVQFVFSSGAQKPPPAGDTLDEIGNIVDDTGKTIIWRKDWAPETSYVIAQTIPLDTWVYVEIDLKRAYADAEWTLPQLKRTHYRWWDTDFRIGYLKLFAEVSPEATTKKNIAPVVYFGPIENQDYQFDRGDLSQEIFEDPAGYYWRLANYHIEKRNYDRAMEAYDMALSYEPDNDHIAQAIEELITIMERDE